jgi:hypothetical protein
MKDQKITTFEEFFEEAERMQGRAASGHEPVVMNSPTRIQRKRIKGWRMPPNTVYVGRRSRWGNPYKIGDPHPEHGRSMSAQETVDLYVELMSGNWNKTAWLTPIQGKNLACWCPPGQPCHADVLLKWANS